MSWGNTICSVYLAKRIALLTIQASGELKQVIDPPTNNSGGIQ